jgi:hypothetical protein
VLPAAERVGPGARASTRERRLPPPREVHGARPARSSIATQLQPVLPSPWSPTRSSLRRARRARARARARLDSARSKRGRRDREQTKAEER